MQNHLFSLADYKGPFQVPNKNMVFGIWEMYHWINPQKNTAVELELSLICTRLKVGEDCKACIWINWNSSLLTTPN